MHGGKIKKLARTQTEGPTSSVQGGIESAHAKLKTRHCKAGLRRF
jgi:hypothetical protein